MSYLYIYLFRFSRVLEAYYLLFIVFILTSLYIFTFSYCMTFANKFAKILKFIRFANFMIPMSCNNAESLFHKIRLSRNHIKL